MASMMSISTWSVFEAAYVFNKGVYVDWFPSKSHMQGDAPRWFKPHKGLPDRKSNGAAHWFRNLGRKQGFAKLPNKVIVAYVDGELNWTLTKGIGWRLLHRD